MITQKTKDDKELYEWKKFKSPPYLRLVKIEWETPKIKNNLNKV